MRFANVVRLVALIGALSMTAAAYADTPTTTPDQGEEDKLICKSVQQTGSRLRKQKVCLTAEDWRARRELTQKTMRDNDKRNTAGPGGQTLPRPGGG